MRNYLILLLAAVVVACETVIPQPPTAEVVIEGEQYFIVDQAGKRWEITHAVLTYGMLPSHFQFGLGVNAIRPIIHPEMILPGGNGYPSSDAQQIVIGATFNGESRAYSINDLTPHEVVDESFGDVHVAVGW